jgi:6-phosphogluconolactonase
MSKKNNLIMGFLVVTLLMSLVWGTQTTQAAQVTPGIAAPEKANSSPQYLVYFGTITGPKSKGIYAYRFDPNKAQLDSIGMVAEIERPTWLAEHPSHKYLYAASDLGNDVDGTIFSYKIDARTGSLTFMNKVSADGGGPTHLAVDETGKMLLAADFGSGRVVAFRLNTDGTIGQQTARMQHTGKSINPRRQLSPHAHGVFIAADSRHVIVPDLGVDKVFSYRLDVQHGTLAPNEPPFVDMPAGYGPRHFAFHPNGQFAYLINEMESAVTAFAYTSATGELKPLQTISTLPDNFVYGTKSGAEVWVDQAGRFLYVSSRSDDTLTVFSIDPRQGTLQPIQRIPTQGKYTWHFAADPTGQYLFVANRDSDNVVIFKIDSGTGKLAPTGQVFSVPSPTCVVFVPGDSQ